MKQFFDTFLTPVGDFSAAVDPTGAVLATAFGGRDRLRRRFVADELVRDSDRLAGVREEIMEYFAGNRERFEAVFALSGTSFQQKAWALLQRIPFGQTRTYGELAAELGQPGAARAVGRANAANPVCLLVPCHRVIGANGSLTGFAFGEDIKRHLLEHEGVSLATKPFRKKRFSRTAVLA